MKKITLLLIVFVLTVFGAPRASGQYVVTNQNSQVIVSNNHGDKVVDIYGRPDNQMTVRVAGVEVVIAGSNTCPEKPKRKKYDNKPRVAFGRAHYQAFLEVGVNALTDVNYRLYSGMELEGVPEDFMVLNNMKSLQWAFSLADMTLFLNRSRSLGLSMALQCVFDDYVFGEQVTLEKADGMVVPVAIDRKYKKSKLTTFSLKVPVMFNIGSSRSLNISAGVYGGVHLQANTKIKKPVERMHDPYMNPFYAGVTARIGYRDFYVYGNYGLTEMFKDGRGPGAVPYTIGLGIGF